MSRPLRLEFAGALYHITSRGDRRGAIFLTDRDRHRFSDTLEQVVEHYGWRVHAWCQMTNHYHLLVETPEPNLSKGMRQLNGVYSNHFNQSTGRVGHVFQGRYTAIVVQRDAYLLELSRYIVLNPVRARMVRVARDWPWTSYRGTAGYRNPPEWLTTEAVLSMFGRSRKAAISRYRRFVAQEAGQSSPWSSLRNQVFLGSDTFVHDLLETIGDDEKLREIPRRQRQGMTKTLSEYETANFDRDAAIVNAYRSGGFTQKQIGDHFGLHYSRVSRIVNASQTGRAKGKT